MTQIFSASRGGGPLIFYDLAKALAERGHELYVVCNLSTEIIEIERVKLFVVKPFLKDTYELPPSPTANLRYIANSLMTGAKIVKQNQIQLIHTNSYTPVFAGSILSKLKNIPMIASIYDVFTSPDKSNWTKWAQYNKVPSYYSTIGRLYEQMSLKLPYDMIHSVSKSTERDIMIHNDKKAIKVIYPAVNFQQYTIQLPKYENFIIFIGRLVFYKNLDVLIRAYAEVIEVLSDAKLVVVGEGPMMDEWTKLAQSLGVSNNVLFTGHIPQEQKLDLLTRCSALALPSVFEGFGLVILESFAMQKPVLVANTHPFDELVDQGKDGFLLDYGDSHEWALAIIRLLSDSSLCKEMGQIGAIKRQAKFDFTAYIDAIESLYSEIIVGSTKRSS